MPQTLIIIGAGFSGLVTFCRLLHSVQRKFNRIILIDDGKAGGLAYGFAEDIHLLNVPAGRMSALVEERDHFLQFARYILPQVQASDFVSRRLYEAYLRWLLESSKRKVAPGLTISCMRDRAVDISSSRGGNRVRILLSSGKSLYAHKVVLATGNQASADIAIGNVDFVTNSRRYVVNPWDAATLGALDTRRPLLLIGTGLTAVDIAMSLHARRLSQPIVMLSRHGLLPQAHRGLAHEPEAEIDITRFDRAAGKIRKLLRVLREEIAKHEAGGGNWRDVIAALRPHTPALWQQLNDTERKRFLRHCQTLWDVHRHRLAPRIAEALQQMQRQQQLNVVAGRIVDVQDTGTGCRVSYRHRGTTQVTTLDVDAIINCTGPSTRLDASGGPLSNNPLLEALSKRGLISQDTHKLGIRTAPDFAVLDANGRPSDIIHYVGPWLRARYWEATAVPELREHVARLVDGLCAGAVLPLAITSADPLQDHSKP